MKSPSLSPAEVSMPLFRLAEPETNDIVSPLRVKEELWVSKEFLGNW